MAQSLELAPKDGSSNTKKIAIIAVFAALAMILHPPFLPLGVPAPYFPVLIYQVWEIPLVVAMLLYGLRVGVLVSIMNFVTLMIFFPGPIITGPLYNLAAIFSTMLGIFLAYNGPHLNRFSRVWFSTLVGLTMRTAIMTVVNGVALPIPPPIGLSIPIGSLPGLLWVIAIFNATLAGYTIPLAYIISKAVTRGTRTASWGESRN